MNKQEIRDALKASTLKSQTINVNIPPLGDIDIVIKELNASKFIKLSEKCTVNVGGSSIMDNKLFINLAIIESIYTIEGEQLFDYADIDLILNMSADLYSKLVVPVFTLNNLTGTGIPTNPKN